MSGSATLVFALACAGIALAAVLWAVREVGRASRRLVTFEGMRAQVAELEASLARAEGENVKMASQLEFLRELATGRKEIEDLTAEIRTMVWVLAGPNARQVQEQRDRDPVPPDRYPPAE